MKVGRKDTNDNEGVSDQVITGGEGVNKGPTDKGDESVQMITGERGESMRVGVQ